MSLINYKWRCCLIGLDNGIIIIGKYNELAKIFGPDPLNANNKENYEICYWRKCWGIRDAIIKELKVNGNGEFKLSKDNILAIINILVYFFDEKIWNNEADSIWSFEEIRECLLKQISNLYNLLAYWNSHPNLEVYFYDSY